MSIYCVTARESLCLAVLVDKTLLLTVRSIGAQFYQVKRYFHQKIRGNDTVCGPLAILAEPSALFLDDLPVRQAFLMHRVGLPGALFFKISSLVDNGLKPSILEMFIILLLSESYDTETTSGRICRATWSDSVSSTISMSYRL